MRHSRFIAYTLLFSLMASVIAGAMSVSIKFVNASPAASDEYVTIGHIKNLITLYGDSNAESINQFIDDNYNTGYILMTFAVNPYNPFIFQLSLVCPMSSTSHFEYFMISGGAITVQNDNNSHPNLKHFYCYNLTNSGFGYHTRIGWYTTSYSSLAGVESLSTNGPIVPGTYADNTESYIYYTNRDIYNSNGVVVHERNILDTDPEPEYIDYSLFVFWIGERRYLTIVDQSLIRQLYGNDLMEYVLFVTYDNDADSEFEEAAYTFLDCTLLQYTGIETQLENVSPNGVYAIDITDKDWLRISGSEIEDITEEFEVICLADNIPLILNEAAPEPGTDGTPNSYTTMWQEFYTYVNNYNLTPIVPDSLSTSLFGINGLQCYPVSIDVPEEVWVSGGNSNHDDLTTWKWWTNQNNLGINFELMDTCIISSGEFLYTLVYFYDSSLQIAFMPVQNVEITELFTMFDCVIIVPDDKGCLDKTTWYEEMVQAIGQTINLNVTFGNNIAISGTSSSGVQYLSSIPETYNDILNGYCFVTPKGIQRQQLFAFSDGVTKVYQLMVDYVESEDDWKSSFLSFTSSLFYGINTLDGTLSKILAAINSMKNSIESKLDTLIQNTSEEEPSHWFPSLWLWVLQFKPSNNDFSVALDVYDDNWDNIPLLPAPSPVPALPTIQGG